MLTPASLTGPAPWLTWQAPPQPVYSASPAPPPAADENAPPQVLVEPVCKSLPPIVILQELLTKSAPADDTWLKETFEETVLEYMKAHPYSDTEVKVERSYTHWVQTDIDDPQSQSFKCLITMRSVHNLKPSTEIILRGLFQPGVQFCCVIDAEKYAEVKQEFGLHITQDQFPGYLSDLLCSTELAYTITYVLSDPPVARIIENSKHRRLCVLALKGDTITYPVVLRMLAKDTQHRMNLAEQLWSRLHDSSKHLERAQRLTETLQAKVEASSSAWEERERELESMHCRMRSCLQETESKLHDAQDELRSLNNDLQRSRQREAEFTTNAANDRAKLSDMLEQQLRLSRDCEGLQESNRKLLGEMDALNHELEMLKRKEQATTDLLKDADRIKEDLSRRKKQERMAKNLAEKLEAENSKLQSIIVEMKAEVRKAEELRKLCDTREREKEEERHCKEVALQEIQDLKESMNKCNCDLQKKEERVKALEMELEQERVEMRRLNIHFAKRLAQAVVNDSEPLVRRRQSLDPSIRFGG